MALTNTQIAAQWQCLPSGLTVQTAPVIEPLALHEVKAYLRVEDDASDDLIAALLTTARLWVEGRTGRALITQTLDVTYDAPPKSGAPLALPRSPASSLTSITSYTPANVASTFAPASYRLDTASTPSRVVLNDGYDWPSDLRAVGALVVRVVAGYGVSAGYVPAPIALALRILVTHWFEQRNLVETTGAQPVSVPMMVDALLAPYVVTWVA